MEWGKVDESTSWVCGGLLMSSKEDDLEEPFETSNGRERSGNVWVRVGNWEEGLRVWEEGLRVGV